MTGDLGLCLFQLQDQKTGTVYGAENEEIVSHGPSNLGFEPATFQAQVQPYSDWALIPQDDEFETEIENWNQAWSLPKPIN